MGYFPSILLVGANPTTLALTYKHRSVEAGETKTELKRLRLILVAAADLPGARSFIPSLKRLIKDSYNQRHRATLPYQYTDELLLWAYALDGKQHAMFWLSPENNETDPFSHSSRLLLL